MISILCITQYCHNLTEMFIKSEKMNHRHFFFLKELKIFEMPWYSTDSHKTNYNHLEYIKTRVLCGLGNMITFCPVEIILNLGFCGRISEVLRQDG